MSTSSKIEQVADASSLNLATHKIWPPVVLAPMAGVTDLAYRTLCWEQGAGLCVSQMVSARGLAERHEATMKLAEVGPDEPIASVQLYATRPKDTHEAVRWLIDELDVDHIDFNFGCPSRKVTRHGGGAALPAKPKLFAQIVSAAVKAAEGRAITVKFRKGISDDLLHFLETGHIAQEAGVAAIALHGRTAEQLYSGKADWSSIAALKEHVQHIPVLGNGDIWVAADAKAMMEATGCDGVVIGRGCLGRPWLFRDLAAMFNGDEIPAVPTAGEVADMMYRHAELLTKFSGTESSVRMMRKHAGWYFTGYPVGKQVRRNIALVSTLAELRSVLDEIDRTLLLPTEAVGLPRGHMSGPKPVSLPHNYLEQLDDATPPSHEADMVISGG